MQSVNDTIMLFINKLSDTTGFKYLKSSRSLKKTVGQMVFEVSFFSSKWNDEKHIEINADFRVSYKKYGAPSTIQSIIASKSIQPSVGSWYDISTNEKFEEVLSIIDKELQATVVDLVNRFEKDVYLACLYLLDEQFYEYNVYLDYLEDILGKEKIYYRVNELIERLSDIEMQQIVEYKNGARNKTWMLNRGNLKYIVDKNYV